jgi:4a-hydroxytetrahydrobiopterin dehydratase
VNRLTPVANELNHHPDLFITWGLVRVSLISHSEHGITEKDFELAKKLDALA